MSGETPIADSQGRFVQVITDGRKRNDIEWIPGRILLSTKRLVLATNEGKRTIPLSSVSSVTSSRSGQSLAQVDSYIKIQADRDVWLIAPTDEEEFEEAIYSALLDQVVVLLKHPAVTGGVVQDTTWEKARMKMDGANIDLAISTGTFVQLDVSDVGSVESTQREIRGSERPMLAIEHTIDDTSVQTHISGSPRHVSLIHGLVKQGAGPDAS